jgi:uncharacterized protein (TIGR02186 family)
MIRALLCCISILCYSLSAHADKPLVAELSSHHITIHSKFDGTNLILFGVRNDSGDIILVVRGPSKKATIRKKEKRYGIWVNRDSQVFDAIPSFYSVASSRPYEEITKSIYFDALQIGYHHAIQRFGTNNMMLISEDERAQREIFAHALLKQMRSLSLYGNSTAPITFIGGGLFHTTIHFPDNTPTGTYTAEVYLVNDGMISGTHTTPIYVYKSGVDALIYHLAHDSPALYGVFAILMACFGGMLAVRLFNRQ